jgi:hypothetical protein
MDDRALRPRLSRRPRRRLEAAPSAPDQGQMGALAREQLRRRSADAAARAGDQNPLARQ